MDGSIRLSSSARKRLMRMYRHSENATLSRRAHVVLLSADGLTWRQIRELLFTSNNFIAATLKRFRARGLAGLRDDNRSDTMPAWLMTVMRWLESHTPQDFGFFRSRWTCEVIAHLLAWEENVRVSRETVRRWLKKIGFVWRRPKPIVGPSDEFYRRKIAQIRNLLSSLPLNETAVFQDEVDINLNPKIGSAWMPRGNQSEVMTPGNNVKQYVYGSLSWRTGRLLVSPACKRRNSENFIAHLDDLRNRLRSYSHIHVICDNASFHRSRVVREYLEQWSHRITIHFLPAYSPETNPIERVWWHLHEVITRNHTCSTIDELVDQAYEWFDTQRFFEVQTTVKYPLAA